MKLPILGVCRIGALVLCGSFALGVWAAEFPAGPVKVTHGLPGGIVDVATRVLAELLGAKWKQPVVVEAKPGANEMLAAETVARGAKDGQNLLVVSEAVMVNNGLLYKKPLVGVERELVFIHELIDIPFALIVRTDLPVNSVKEFVELMKKDGKRYNYASSGIGSPLHLAMEGFGASAGFQAVHVPYKAIAQLQQDMMGGSVDAAFLGVNTAMAFVKTGKLKMLAVSGASRAGLSPQTPTFTEAGYPNVDYKTTIAMMAPSGTPADLLARIASDVREVLQSEEYTKRFLGPQDLKAGTADGRQMTTLIAARRSAAKRLIEALDLKLE